uniref:RNA helicase n=1 Tax=Romanomermis culicivorax TaxID=13658 RepID=A0A915K2A6_ROMCU
MELRVVLRYSKDQRQRLPIYAARHEILTQIQKNSCTIIIGETGSGKTTQIPQFLLEEKLNKSGQLYVTQPRRIAAISLSMRVAEEVGCELGTTVGYSVRFDTMVSEETQIQYMTDGMLLREAMRDPLLRRASIIVLDEVHERTLHTDVTMGIVKRAQMIRHQKYVEPLKIVVMSATMNVDHFSLYFHNSPVVYIEGRQYPVQLMYASQSSQANQRAGRAGREAPGFCYRLYKESDYDMFEANITPEISRCNLSTVTLELLSMKINEISKFDFMDKPPQASIDNAIRQLKFLNAVEEVDSKLQLTAYRHSKGARAKEWCIENFVHQRNIETVDKVRTQLKDICLQHGMQISSSPASNEPLRKALCHGLFLQCAEFMPPKEYKTIDGNLKASIHPSSCLFQHKPSFVLYSELVFTNQLYIRIRV